MLLSATLLYISFSCIHCIQIEILFNGYVKYYDNILQSKNYIGLSEKCANIINTRKFTHTKMFQASSKIPQDIEAGNLFDLGNFDECYNYEDTLGNDTIYGKYCLGFIPIELNALHNAKSNTSLKIFGENGDVGLRSGFCLPSSCTTTDFEKKFYRHVFTENKCYSKATLPKMSIGTIITMYIFMFIAVIVILSTLYEFVLLQKQEEAHQLFTIFSLIKNGKKVFAISYNAEQMLCLNGIKAISMIWIIFYHEYLNTLMGPISNLNTLLEFFNQKSNMYIFQANVAVDTFFAIGGLLASYTILKSIKRNTFSLGWLYFHRYLRLTPVLAVAILLHATLIIYIEDGPLWNNIETVLSSRCRKYWWSALLYIQNYVNPTEDCVPQSWYLSVDMQCFVLSPLILFSLQKWRTKTIYSLVVLIILGVIIPFYVSYVNNFPAAGFSYGENIYEYLEKLYMKTHTRFGPYVVGMLAGYYLYDLQSVKKRITLPVDKLVSIWVVTIIALLFCVFGSPGSSLETLPNAIFNSLHRTIWSISICAIIFLCVTDNAKPVNTFLSMPIFQIISKLSYCMYITHYAVIYIRVASLKVPITFSMYHLVLNFWIDFIVTLLISFFCSTIFETSLQSLESYLSSKKINNEKKIMSIC